MDTSNKPDNVAAVMKVFAVLEALAEEKQMSLTELAQKALTSKSTAYRFLQTMKDLGYVQQDGEMEKYGLTLKLFGLGASVLNHHVDLIAVADPAMSRVSEATHEAIHLGVLDDTDQSVVYVHKFDSRFNLCMQTRVGRRNPPYNTALGKVLLAWQDAEDVRRRLAEVTFVKVTPHTLPDTEAVMAELPVVRGQGYAEENEEGEIGVRCLAVPVFDRIGKVVAAISISFPVVRYDQAKKADYVGLLHEAGRRVSESLGFHDYRFAGEV
ncbi:DNA-binding transcriptional regulator KdgR [Consotaella aegiceratis]|uniref:DNA-binding transcriptional regulator KdgR n=1 Tax=Consotaella aegiceratis TaxID=3097961 RepID=UPI002F41D3F4